MDENKTDNNIDNEINELETKTDMDNNMEKQDDNIETNTDMDNDKEKQDDNIESNTDIDYDKKEHNDNIEVNMLENTQKERDLTTNTPVLLVRDGNTSDVREYLHKRVNEELKTAPVRKRVVGENEIRISQRYCRREC